MARALKELEHEQPYAGSRQSCARKRLVFAGASNRLSIGILQDARLQALLMACKPSRSVSARVRLRAQPSCSMEARHSSVAAAIDALSDLPKLSEGDHGKCDIRSLEERRVVSGNRGAVGLRPGSF